MFGVFYYFIFLLLNIFVMRYYLRKRNKDVTYYLRNRINNGENIYLKCRGGLGNRLLSFNGILLIGLIRRKYPKCINTSS